MKRHALFVAAVFVIALFSPHSVRADLSQKDARKVIQTMAGWSLPSNAVRIESIGAGNAETPEVRAEIQAVFRSRFRENRCY